MLNSGHSTEKDLRKSEFQDEMKGKTRKTVKTVKTHKKRKTTTLFDAVAGEAGYESLLPRADRTSKYRDTKSTSKQAIPPEEVLFRRKRAPVRYEEKDIYFANERLPPDQKLPDSDLLKDLHCYASSFYQNATTKRGKKDWESMDETALLALGILLEEASAEHLGESGDLAFLEDESEDLPTGRRQYWDGERWARSVVLKKAPNRSTDV